MGPCPSMVGYQFLMGPCPSMVWAPIPYWSCQGGSHSRGHGGGGGNGGVFNGGIYADLGTVNLFVAKYIFFYQPVVVAVSTVIILDNF